MTSAPVILVTGDFEARGAEFGDDSLSASLTYQHALAGLGALPLVLGDVTAPSLIADAVRRCDGVLLTGGEDLDPRLYRSRLPARLRAKVRLTPDHGRRDLRELLLLAEVFRQRKPLLAVCRGHQMLNVALGGTLWVDLASECPAALDHRQMERRAAVVHQVAVLPGSLLARVIGANSLGVNSTHHQAVARVAGPLRAVATGPDGIVEALELAPANARWLPFLLGVQFHPERLAADHPAHRAIFAAFVEGVRLAGR